MKVLNHIHRMNIRNLRLAFVYCQAQDASLNLIGRALSFLPRLFDLSRDHFLALFYERSSVIWLAINNKSLGISVPVILTGTDIPKDLLLMANQITELRS